MATTVPSISDSALDEQRPFSEAVALLLDTFAASYPAVDDEQMAEVSLNVFFRENVSV